MSFRVAGRIATSDSAARQWWRDYFLKVQRDGFLKDFPESFDYLTSREAKLALKHPLIFGRTTLASFNRAQFRSYGLGASAAGLSIVTAESCRRDSGT